MVLEKKKKTLVCVGQILNIYLESPNFSFAFQFLHKFVFLLLSFGNGSWKKVIVDHATFKEKELVLKHSHKTLTTSLTWKHIFLHTNSPH